MNCYGNAFSGDLGEQVFHIFLRFHLIIGGGGGGGPGGGGGGVPDAF